MILASDPAKKRLGDLQSRRLSLSARDGGRNRTAEAAWRDPMHNYGVPFEDLIREKGISIWESLAVIVVKKPVHQHQQQHPQRVGATANRRTRMRTDLAAKRRRRI